jgi:dihydroneopterin aldolase
VDLELVPNDERAESSDRLADAVDYDMLYRTVREVVEGQSFHLLEALAARVASYHPGAVRDPARARCASPSRTSAGPPAGAPSSKW